MTCMTGVGASRWKAVARNRYGRFPNLSSTIYMGLLLDAINKATGIPKENILINTSQTHNWC